jgi:hypothetical protein
MLGKSLQMRKTQKLDPKSGGPEALIRSKDAKMSVIVSQLR